MQFSTPPLIEPPLAIESERVNERIRLTAALRQRAKAAQMEAARAVVTPAQRFLASQRLHESCVLEKVADWIELGEI